MSGQLSSPLLSSPLSLCCFGTYEFKAVKEWAETEPQIHRQLMPSFSPGL